MSARLRAMALQAEEQGENAGRKNHYRSVVKANGRWSNTIELVEEALTDPLKWRNPRTIFVNSMSDLFHQETPAAFIRRVFEVMETASWHTFQVLTKRPERAKELARSLPWPPNVWLGTSVENDSVLNRVESLRRIPASIRFLSIEPLLGPLHSLDLADINWIIVGGESGPKARPMKPEWVRGIRDKAISNKVPFFFKQWGGKNKKATGRILDGRTWDEMPMLSHLATHG